MVKLLRRVDFKVPQNQKDANDAEFLIQDPEDMDYFTSNIDQKLLEVDELINGDNFGEMSLINKSRIEFSAITSMPTEILVLDDFEI
jgi:CRP-like cAMP-binding protein